jgi:UDP-N-acetylbacillosamine N-acetyltransferase
MIPAEHAPERPLMVWGAAGHAKVVADIARLCSLRIVGFLDDLNASRNGETFCGAKVYVERSCLERFWEQGIRSMAVAIGAPRIRLELAGWASQMGFSFPPLVHPRATVAAGVELAPGTVAMAGSVINSGTSLGTQCIINTGATVDHDCVLGDGATICPGVHLGGGVQVGRAVWVGIGACVRDHLAIGDASLIGAGAVVTKNIPPAVVAYGVPARVVRPIDAS